jgi:hypothetical protein
MTHEIAWEASPDARWSTRICRAAPALHLAFLDDGTLVFRQKLAR